MDRMRQAGDGDSPASGDGTPDAPDGFPGKGHFPGDNLPPAADFIPDNAKQAAEQGGKAAGLAWLLGLL